MPFIANEVRLLPVRIPQAIDPEHVADVDCGEYIASALVDSEWSVCEHDVIVVSSKVASMLSGEVVHLADVVPTRKAKILGKLFHRDARKVQLVLEQGKILLVVPMKWILRIPTLREIMERRSSRPESTVQGYEERNPFTFVVRKFAAFFDEAGIDQSNSPGEYAILLPDDPCDMARTIREAIRVRTQADVAVIITDTLTSLGRVGSQDVAIGYAGIDPVTRETFHPDLFGVPRAGGIDLVIDSIAGMSGLVMGQTIEKTPFVIVRGISYQPERSDELPGMDAVAWPDKLQGRIALLTLWATLRLWFGNLIAFQPRTRKSRRT